MSMQRKDGTMSMRIICAIFFLVFTSLYLYKYQSDILAVTQHVLSNGATHYNKVIGTILITLSLWLVQIAVHAASKLNHRAHALTYIPSLLLLAVLTDVSPHLAIGNYLGVWLWLFPLLMVLYVGVVWFFKQLESMEPVSLSFGLFSRLTWVNLLQMSIMALVVCGIGCSDTVFHCRMRMESDLLKGDYVAAARVGKHVEETDSSLTMLRILALTKTNSLCERLFEYPLTGGSDAMFPNGTSVKVMMLPEDSIYANFGVVFKEKLRPLTYLQFVNKSKYTNKVSKDWLLCAYLLDCNLDQFVKTLPSYYQVTQPLPKAFREALVLYNHLRKKPKIIYRESTMDTDYEDFKKAYYLSSDPTARISNVKDNFGTTYWFYYLTHAATHPVRSV